MAQMFAKTVIIAKRNTWQPDTISICGDLPVSSQLHRGFIKNIPAFIIAINSNDESFQLCAMLALNGSCSAASNNVNFIWH